MTKEEISFYQWGYDECRNILIGKIKSILERKSGYRMELESLFSELTQARDKGHWETIQKEQPGITRAEYEAQLEELGKKIREAYFSKEGFLKPRLMWNRNVDVKNKKSLVSTPKK